jgi:hypothetical protein
MQTSLHLNPEIELTFKLVNGGTIKLKAYSGTKISILKQQLKKYFFVGDGEPVLIFGAKFLADGDKCLREYKIENNDYIYLYVEPLKTRKDSENSTVT